MAVEKLAETQDSVVRRKISIEISSQVTYLSHLVFGLRKIATSGRSPLKYA